MIKVDISGALGEFSAGGPNYALAAAAHRTLFEKSGAGAEFTGWLELPSRIKSGELKRIQAAAKRIRSNSEVLVVIGVGGSYLGARAAIELLAPKDGVEVVFAGNGLSPHAMRELTERVADRDFSINVISKSGTTLEPALAFRVFRELAKKKYGSAAAKRIYATTDAQRGVLRTLAASEGYETFTVPDDVGGRYSVLSAVGLLPMAAAGIDAAAVLSAAESAMRELDLRSPENPAWKYAAARQQLYARGKSIEILASYEPRFRWMAEWWKQLFGESEGKNGIGIFPAYVEYTADLHSMGQYIQDGPRTLMETTVLFEDAGESMRVPFALGDPDGLNYLAGREYADVCAGAASAVKKAHIDGGVPNITITAGAMNEEGFAQLVCFFELACGISAYMSGVNPFDQPGVEAYKKNMFAMLGKPW